MKRMTLIKTLFVQVICVTIIMCNTITGNAQWVKKNDITGFEPGRWGSMSFTINNKIYVGGGYLGSSGITTQWWGSDLNVYDPSTGGWAAKKPLPGTAKNRTSGVAFVIGGKAYLGLGAEDFLSFTGSQKNLKDLWGYDATADTWVKKADLPDSGVTDAGVFVVNNKAYVVGGSKSSSGSGANTNKVWEYDPATNKWTAKAPYPGTDLQSPFAFSVNGKGFVTGGESGSGYTFKTYQYDAAANSWIPKKDYPGDSARGGGVVFVVNGMAYCGLGSQGYGNYPKSFYGYDPVTDTWHYLQGSQLPWVGRAFGVAQVVNNKVYIGGGWRIDGSSQQFYKDWYELDYNGLLGIHNVPGNDNKLSCYPNPSTGLIHVNIDTKSNSTYNLYNITGQKLITNSIPADKTINISQLPAGQYILEVTTGDVTKRAMVSLQ